MVFFGGLGLDRQREGGCGGELRGGSFFDSKVLQPQTDGDSQVGADGIAKKTHRHAGEQDGAVVERLDRDGDKGGSKHRGHAHGDGRVDVDASEAVESVMDDQQGDDGDQREGQKQRA